MQDEQNVTAEWLAPLKSRAQISARKPAALTEMFRGIPQSL
jgi:hypothetical protein